MIPKEDSNQLVIPINSRKSDISYRYIGCDFIWSNFNKEFKGIYRFFLSMLLTGFRKRLVNRNSGGNRNFRWYVKRLIDNVG